jgi:hypothetical protein
MERNRRHRNMKRKRRDNDTKKNCMENPMIANDGAHKQPSLPIS